MDKRPVICLAFANDKHNQFLNSLQEELDEIKQSLTRYQNQGGIVYPISPADPNKILAGFREFIGQILIFHFSGHSDGIGLQLEAPNHEEIFLHGKNLSSILKEEAKANLKLVFLNACVTNNLVNAFQKIGIPAIIATNSNISDNKAKSFSIAFYKALISGLNIEDAFNHARIEISPEDESKRIFVRGMVREQSQRESEWGLYILYEEILKWKITDSIGQNFKNLNSININSRFQSSKEGVKTRTLNKLESSLDLFCSIHEFIGTKIIKVNSKLISYKRPLAISNAFFKNQLRFKRLIKVKGILSRYGYLYEPSSYTAQTSNDVVSKQRIEFDPDTGNRIFKRDITLSNPEPFQLPVQTFPSLFEVNNNEEFRIAFLYGPDFNSFILPEDPRKKQKGWEAPNHLLSIRDNRGIPILLKEDDFHKLCEKELVLTGVITKLPNELLDYFAKPQSASILEFQRGYYRPFNHGVSTSKSRTD